MDWAAFENTIAGVVATASGLATGKMFWEGQTPAGALTSPAVAGAGRPALPYATLWREGPTRVSPFVESSQKDNPGGHVGDPTAHPPLIGTELLQTVRVPAEIRVRIQMFSSTVRGAGAAHALLAEVASAQELDSVRDILGAAGVDCVERGPVSNLSDLIETRIEGRASMDLRMRVMVSAQETMTWIEHVVATPIIDGVTGAPITAP